MSSTIYSQYNEIFINTNSAPEQVKPVAELKVTDLYTTIAAESRQQPAKPLTSSRVGHISMLRAVARGEEESAEDDYVIVDRQQELTSTRRERDALFFALLGVYAEMGKKGIL